LGSLLFSAEDVYKKIAVLSGGEESRVAVAKLMLTKSNMLLLDEPTNHLDIPSKEVFEEALKEFDGTILVISHDRYLLKSIADRMMFIEEGKCYTYDFGYEKANELFTTAILSEAASAEKSEEIKPQKIKNETLSKNMLKRSRERVVEIEQKLEQIEDERKRLEEEINGENFYKDMNEADRKLKLLEEMNAAYHAMEEEWIELNYLLEDYPETGK